MSKADSKAEIRNHLESLTKDELITLILKFAPQSFIDNINSQFADKKEILSIFDKTSKAIDNILSDEELLYNPSGFERERGGSPRARCSRSQRCVYPSTQSTEPPYT